MAGRVGQDDIAAGPAKGRPGEGDDRARIQQAIDQVSALAPDALGFALADRMVKAELDAFNRAVTERFGERSLLTDAARGPSGPAFDKAAEGMVPDARQKLATAWPLLRASQQLAAHERTQQALKESEALRQTQRQSQGLKQ